jgi:tetratricopeptide (TPR) repeat protein
VDCEKFDRITMDFLYGELDQLTSAAADRHMEHCTRCRDIGSRLRATRDVGRMPLVDPPDGLELRVAAAEKRARAEAPLGQRLGRGVSVLASYAMRPQLAMALLLLLVIASSLILLRGRPGEQMNLFVTGRGVPESEVESVAIVPRRELDRPRAPEGERPERASDTRSERTAPSARASATAQPEQDSPSVEASTDRDYEAALAAYRDRRYDDAQRRFEALAARGGSSAASAALYAAQSARARAGCPTAAPLFEQTFQRFPDTQPGYESAWQAAGCYRTLGDFERARHHYELLLKKPGYADRAQAALASMGDIDPLELAKQKEEAQKTAPPAPSAKPYLGPSP